MWETIRIVYEILSGVLWLALGLLCWHCWERTKKAPDGSYLCDEDKFKMKNPAVCGDL